MSHVVEVMHRTSTNAKVAALQNLAASILTGTSNGQQWTALITFSQQVTGLGQQLLS